MIKINSYPSTYTYIIFDKITQYLLLVAIRQQAPSLVKSERPVFVLR